MFKSKKNIPDVSAADNSELPQNGVITLDDILGSNQAEQNQSNRKNKKAIKEPVGMKEIIPETEDSSVKLLENPLPIPKRKKHKEMDYAINDLTGQDYFDIDDMTGMDYFDIE